MRKVPIAILLASAWLVAASFVATVLPSMFPGIPRMVSMVASVIFAGLFAQLLHTRVYRRS